MYRKINLILILVILLLLGFYIYQTISIASGSVALVALKKELFETKDGVIEEVKNDFNFASAKESLGMTEIEKLDYLILGPSEFAQVKEVENEN